jgi:hypothetical protein
VPACALAVFAVRASPGARSSLTHGCTLCVYCFIGGAAGTVIALMAFARHKGVNLSVLGIGVDFLQVR